MKKRVVTLVETLIVPATLVAACIAAPVSAFAASGQQAFSAAEVRQVSDALQKMNAALSASLAKNPQKPRGAFSRLVTDGFLPAFPPVPDGIGDGSGYFGKGDYGAWSDRNDKVGGCGPNNIGEKRTYNILLRNVSDEFCKAYNKGQGLSAAILGNCAQDPTACSGSGSTDGNSPVDAGKVSFCYKTTDATNIVLFNTGVDATIPCE